VTTPAAAKLYRAPTGATWQDVRLSVEQGASLEWLPLETIVFSGARAQTRLCADISAHGRLVAWDVVCFGRPASDEPFDEGVFDSVIELVVDGELRWIERTRIPGYGDDRLGQARWGLGGHCVMGTLMAVGPVGISGDTMQMVRDYFEAPGCGGVTDVDGALVVRVLGDSAWRVRDKLCTVWEVLRPWLLGKLPVWPRIWAT